MDAPLTLKDKMVATYLIQRLQTPIGAANPFSFGGGLHNGGLSDNAMKLLMGIFSFDYMGAAEFEWGAVPRALHFIAERAEAGSLVTGKLDGPVYYVCPVSYQKDVIERITNLRTDEYKFRLKEHCGLQAYFSPNHKRSIFTTLGWLELDNGFAFFVDIEMYKKFCKLFRLEAIV